MRSTSRLVEIIAMLVAAGSLTACGTLSHKVAQDGSGAEQLVWPAVDDTGPLHTDGTWPTLNSLRLITSGMTKEQVMALIGPPHFSEGFVAVREWNYLFHLRDPNTGTVRLCQYKILFDTDALARSFYWQPAGCGDVLDAKPIAAVPQPVAAAPHPVTQKPQTVLTVAALFKYDEYGLDDIKAAGRAQLAQIVGGLKQRAAGGDRIVVAGYAGPIGGDGYNRVLSRNRAETVREYLVTLGVPSDAIEARGRGSSQAAADCRDAVGAAARACNAPNRRVTITVVPGT